MLEIVRGHIIGEIERPFRLYINNKQISPATEGRFDFFKTKSDAIDFYLENFSQLKNTQGEVREYDI